MKLRKIIAVAAIALAATTAQAKYDADIHLSGGSTNPQGAVIIPLDKLMPGVDYDVYCNIRSDVASGSSDGYIKIYADIKAPSKLFMDDKLIASNQQTKIDSYGSLFRAYKITSESHSIMILNLDDTDTITISTCNAWPTTTDELKRA